MKSLVRILLLAVALLFAVQSPQSVHGILLSNLRLQAVGALDTVDAPDAPAKAGQQGNDLVRALKAPFRALERLFSRKKDKHLLHRISEKDIKKFESAKANRTDNSMPVTPAAAEKSGDGNDAARSHLEKGRSLLNSGNVNEAIAELSTAASLDPKLGEAYTLLGVAYDRKGLNDMARQSFQAALGDTNDPAMHLNNLGFLLYKQGEYKEAAKYLKRAAKLAPTDERIWNNLGLAQAELGKFDEAYKSFGRIGGEFNGRLNIAARLESQGLNEKATKQLEKALLVKPKSREALARLAALYEREGRTADAQKVRSTLADLNVVADTNSQKKDR
jgi:Flp pilus assembly protein TadD